MSDSDIRNTHGEDDWLATRLRADAKVCEEQMVKIDSPAPIARINAAIDDLEAKKDLAPTDE